MQQRQIEQTLTSIAQEYPSHLVPEQLSDVKRMAFNLELVIARKGRNITICDLGGGIGLFSLGCAALGMNSILVDDFGDQVNLEFERTGSPLHEKYGVKVVSSDLINDGIEFPESSLDVVTTFDSMEHWHHSPKNLFKQVMTALKPGGLFIIGVPNCVNLRKRLTIPFGAGSWSPMDEWYEKPEFRGHVREPDVKDLRYIARDLGLTDVEIRGRNWLGYNSPHKVTRLCTALVDGILSNFPSLCSNLYLIGRKPGSS